MKKKVFFAPVFALLLVLTSCGNSTQKEVKSTKEVDDARVIAVKTQTIKMSTVSRSMEYTTSLQAEETVKIAPSTQGKIEHIYVREGDYVTKGQDLVRMDQTQYQTTLISYNNQKVNMDRMDQLIKTGSITQQAYDQAQMQLASTKENLDFLKLNTYVTAPISGYISAKGYEDGELYAGQPIVVITKINPLKSLVNIPENYYPYVSKGKDYALTVDIYKDTVFSAKVRTVYPTIDATSHTFKAELSIDNRDKLLRPGMFARVKVDFYAINAIIVPYQAVLKMLGSNQRYVFLCDQGVARRANVELGQRFNDQIEIISPEIKLGDEIVILGQGKLTVGTKLKQHK